MNLVQFWKDQVALWNEEQKCGLCWEFGAPLTESAANMQQSTDGKECCVQVLLVRDRVNAFNTQNTYDPRTSLLTNVVCNTGFQLLFLLQHPLGINNFNEIKDHPEEESIWTTRLSKIEECISCEVNLDFCTLIGSQYRVTQWSAVQLINHFDNNYSGYRLTVNFQTTK